MPIQPQPEPARRLPREVKLCLLALLALGGILGGVASILANHLLQLGLVAVAVSIGIYAGRMIHATRRIE